MKAKYLEAVEALERKDSSIFIDVRSPAEYTKGHVPGAVSLPLLDNEQRTIVGKCYKQRGRAEAIRTGFRLVGPSLYKLIEQVDEWKTSQILMVYCWRGGMRSEAMAWLLSTAGHKVMVVSGGYKALRKALLETFSRAYRFTVLSGYTGSGKSRWLQELRDHGDQILDLEGIASHKGSSFGSLGMPEQPSQEHFENLLGMQLRSVLLEKPVWVEHESRTIGRCCIPEGLYNQLGLAPLIFISVPLKRRIQQLVEDYACYPKEQLAASISRIAKKLGPQDTKEALSSLSSQSYATVAALALRYYDRCYMYDVHQHRSPQQIHIDASNLSDREIAARLRTIQSTLENL